MRVPFVGEGGSRCAPRFRPSPGTSDSVSSASRACFDAYDRSLPRGHPVAALLRRSRLGYAGRGSVANRRQPAELSQDLIAWDWMNPTGLRLVRAAAVTLGLLALLAGCAHARTNACGSFWRRTRWIASPSAARTAPNSRTCCAGFRPPARGGRNRSLHRRSSRIKMRPSLIVGTVPAGHPAGNVGRRPPVRFADLSSMWM